VQEIEPPSENRLVLPCYLCGPLIAIVCLTMKVYRSDRFLRFHAFQSIVFFVIFGLWLFVIGPRIRHIIADSITFVFFLTWIVLIVKAYKGTAFKLPIIGNLANYCADLDLPKS
jgi:uncharacterized membrane protein